MSRDAAKLKELLNVVFAVVDVTNREVDDREQQSELRRENMQEELRDLRVRRSVEELNVPS
jgi:hypothetical protein